MSDRPIALPHVRKVAARFRLEGRVTGARPHGSGHIHDTYAVTVESAGSRRLYIFQRINHHIFKDVPHLMENIRRVTDHVRAKLAACPGSDPDRETLTLVPAVDGGSYVETEDGEYWRVYLFIEDAQTYDVLEDSRKAYEAAKAFGRFQEMLSDLPGEPLFETIPNFHHTPRRLEALKAAIEKDAFNRCASARKEIEFTLARESMTPVVLDMMADGRVPVRITHNDTKINNVMIDDATGNAICVIDLDTVMNGSALYDFGDLVRTCTAMATEDERDLAKVGVDMELFVEVVRGYLAGAGGFLTKTERDNLAFSGRLITLTIGIRFLTDYLSGDTYFKSERQGQNLDRARVQLKMVEEMERRSEEMEKIVRESS